MHAQEKKGMDFGLDTRQSKTEGAVPARVGAEYKFQPGDRSVPVWDDECNYDPGLAAKVSLNGCESTAYKLALSKGIQKV